MGNSTYDIEGATPHASNHSQGGADPLTNSIENGMTGATTQQAAIDALTAVSGATIGHALVKDADGHATWAAVGGSMTTEVLTGTGNWTVPVDVYIVYVTMSGAGGNGAAGTSGANGGGGGGGAATIIEMAIPVVPGEDIAYNVPAVGSAGACTFGNLQCAGGRSASTTTGGNGGPGTYNAVAGGLGGTLNVAGAKPVAEASKTFWNFSIPGSGGGGRSKAGGASILYGAIATSPTGIASGNANKDGGGGGDSAFGGGGASVTDAAGQNGKGYGGGGGGGSGTGNAAGGSGAAGCVILRY